LLEIELVQKVLGNNSVTLFTPRQRVQVYHLTISILNR
jgi:hypothetical protein